ncbi:hypothetical protein WJ72_10970 [Burkholderia ubonensis]|nr:hypothetical protein WJ72_10970 [Burkholderia ubonensis]
MARQHSLNVADSKLQWLLVLARVMRISRAFPFEVCYAFQGADAMPAFWLRQTSCDTRLLR